MKTASINIAGNKYPACFSIGAIKALAKRYGDISKMGEQLKGGDLNEKKIDDICYIVITLTKSGCAYLNRCLVTEPLDTSFCNDGEKYLPPCEEEFLDTVGIAELGDIVGQIFDCIGDDSESEIEVETEGKETAPSIG